MKYGRGLLFQSRRTFGWLLALCACGLAVLSAPAQQPAAASSSPATAVPSSMHGVIQLDGPWHFQMGDDPLWSDPTLDDSGWLNVVLGESLAEQGFESYAGYAWYRLRIHPSQLHLGGPDSGPLRLLVTPYSVGQVSVYVDGVEVGHTRGMTGSPKMYESLPIDVPLPQVKSDQPVMVAVRTWAAPGIPITHGLLERVEAGTREDIADRVALAVSHKWNQRIIAEMVLAFLFLGVAALG